MTGHPMKWLSRTSHWKFDIKWPLKKKLKFLKGESEKWIPGKHRQVQRRKNVKTYLEDSEQFIIREVKYLLEHMRNKTGKGHCG